MVSSGVVKAKVSSLVVDFSLYPRGQVDRYHVRQMAEAEAAGVVFPPILADKASKRVVDGVHRIRKQLRVYGENAEIDCQFKKFKDESEMLLTAMALNANHGRNLSAYDKAHCVQLAEEFKINDTAVCAALNMTLEVIAEIRVSKFAQTKEGSITSSVPLKATIRHKSGMKLTSRQAEVNRKLGGMRQLFYVNQLIMLIESDLLDKKNENLMEAIAKLKNLL